MAENGIRLLVEQFVNEKTGEAVEGITIMVDGSLKKGLDILIQDGSGYRTYAEIIKDALFTGLEQLAGKHRGR